MSICHVVVSLSDSKVNNDKHWDRKGGFRKLEQGFAEGYPLPVPAVSGGFIISGPSY